MSVAIIAKQNDKSSTIVDSLSVSLLTQLLKVHTGLKAEESASVSISSPRNLTMESDHSVKPHTATAAAKSLLSCPTLCDPVDGSPPGSPVPGILQARTLEWVAICFSNAWKWKVKVKSPSRVRLPATPRSGAHQAAPSLGVSRQEHWSGVPLPSPSTS